jgi:hypothetical protein
MAESPENPGREDADDARREDEEPADLDISAEEADAVKGGAVSSTAPSGKPIGH